MKKTVLSAAMLAVLGLCGAHALKPGESGVTGVVPVTASAAPMLMSEGIRSVPEGATEANPLLSADSADPLGAAAGEPAMSLVSLASNGGAGSDASMPRMALAWGAQGGASADSSAAEAPDFGDGLLALADGHGLGDAGPGAFIAAGAGFGHPNLAPTGPICQTFGGGSCDLSNVPATELRSGDAGGKSVRFGADEFAVSSAITAPIPEPSTYALMFIGLVIIGAAVRRRCNDQE